MFEGTILHFHCQTASPFHTTRQRYANLVKCAPFILGSTLRGAVLDTLVRTCCSPQRLASLESLNDPAAIAEKHSACTEACPVRPFFAQPPLVRFSFATFEDVDYRMMTRIGLSRETRSVVEGSIFTIEAVSTGVHFDFEVILLGQALEIAETAVETVRHVAALGSIGGFRSIGLGRFEVVSEPQRIPLDDRLDQMMAGWPRPRERAQLTFTTPFVLGAGGTPETMGGEPLARYVVGQIDRAAAQAGYTVERALPLERADVRVRPDFISRFSYEQGLRENRLVAWPNSSLGFDWPETVDADGLALALALGIGEWSAWGFGRFSVGAEHA
jgi:hypothetical protein